MNQLFQQLQTQNNNGIFSLVNSLKSSSNPTQLFTSIAQQNPKIQGILSQINTSGLTPKEYFMKQANSSGVDVQSILSQLR